MGNCRICKTGSPVISSTLGVCLNCIRSKPEEALEITREIHSRSRRSFDLPEAPPRAAQGLPCGQCANNCCILEGCKGYCGLVENCQGRLLRHGGTPDKGVLEWYYDPLPTNCVSWWSCPGCTGVGYPEYTDSAGPEVGYRNLAVFYGSCSTDCLFCQNWHHRRMAKDTAASVSAGELATKATSETSCICFFGGDPSTQMPHALVTSETILKGRPKKRNFRICWETNGRMNPGYLEQAAGLSLRSGGNIKFDLKTWSPHLHEVLCGTPNRITLDNFQTTVTKYYAQRPKVPLVTASTLLVPGYVDVTEIREISRFIAELNPSIPYTLLAFYPTYILNDIPATPKKQAEECYRTAKKTLKNVRIGNINLLR
ncbi:MAG: radical SAM protein [Candidatus Bathyarchaeota archaeon]|nr:MAG: radical SAM protein [Candidatus Bathyarchaeota archaeon]